jgi:hypothetical protein
LYSRMSLAKITAILALADAVKFNYGDAVAELGNGHTMLVKLRNLVDHEHDIYWLLHQKPADVTNDIHQFSEDEIIAAYDDTCNLATFDKLYMYASVDDDLWLDKFVKFACDNDVIDKLKARLIEWCSCWVVTMSHEHYNKLMNELPEIFEKVKLTSLTIRKDTIDVDFP